MQWLIALAVLVLAALAPHMLAPGALARVMVELQPLLAGLLGGVAAPKLSDLLSSRHRPPK